MKERLSVKPKKLLQKGIRGAIQLFFFLLYPSVFTAAFAGMKYIASQMGNGEKLEWTAFLAVLAGLCLFTIVFGRFFCGFACAFGSFGDAVRAIYVWVCRKMKKKPQSLPAEWGKLLSGIKYVMLLVILVLCFTGRYSNFRGNSPWDVFSMLQAGKFRLSGYIPGLVLLVLILFGMCVQERFFCRFLCPMGAVFDLLPVLPVFALRRDREQCIKGCSACTRVCPSQIGLAEDGSFETAEDCFLCQKCTATCPKKHIHCSCGKIRGNETWFTILRAVLLLALFQWLGI